MTMTADIKISGEGIEVVDSLVVHASERAVAMEVVVANKNIAVAAFGDGIVPSVILTDNSFNLSTDTSQTKSFFKLSFPNLKGFKVWSCDISCDSLKLFFIK